ncbi:carbohydrate ABC transporter substrate-binding protein [Candidatus Bipolaricaulota bacterium]|nr:carbohydrate ABC transporter substrate-binding protein [Candidatus Bipolaricaulota bacterium]
MRSWWRVLGVVAVVGALSLGAWAEKLVVIGPWSGDEAKPFEAVLQAFTEKTGIEIEYRVMRSEDLGKVLPAQFAAGIAPGDVLLTAWGWWVKKFADHMVDLSAEVADVPFGFLTPIVVEGRTVGIPYAVWVKPGFWYRKSLFEAHGLKSPTSWAEFYGLLERLEAIEGIEDAAASGDEVGWPLSDTVEHFILAVGGKDLFLDLTAGKVEWQSPEVRAIFENFIIPYLEHASEPIEWTSAKDLWWEGKYGIYFMGNWLTGMVDDPSDLGVFALPGAKAVTGGTDYIFVPKYSERIDDAKKLVAFLMSKEGQEIRAAGGGKLAIRTDVSPDAYPPAEKALIQALQGFKIVPDMDDTIGGEWQAAFWDQLKLLWVKPEALDDVLRVLDEKFPKG